MAIILHTFIRFARATQNAYEFVANDLFDVGASGFEIFTRIELVGLFIEESSDRSGHRTHGQRSCSVRTAIVYEGHLAPIVEADGYFDAVIPFRTLLGL